MQVTYTVKNYAGVKNQDHNSTMDFEMVRKNLQAAGCTLNLDKLEEAVSYGFGVIIDEFQIEIRLVR